MGATDAISGRVRTRAWSWLGASLAVTVLAVALVDLDVALLIVGPFAAAAPFVALWLVRDEAPDVRRPWLDAAIALVLGLVTQVLYAIAAAGVDVASGVGAGTSLLSYVFVIKALLTMDRLRGADGIVAGIDAATVALAALLVAWHVGIDADTSVAVMGESMTWLAMSLAAAVVMVRLVLTGLGSLVAMRLMAVALTCSVIAELIWFTDVVGFSSVRFELPALFYVVAVLTASAGIAHPSRAAIVSSATVSRGTSSLPVAGLVSGLVAVGVLGLGERSSTADVVISVLLGALVVVGIGIQIFVRDRVLRRINAQLELRLDYDHLTGLLNRNGIRRRLEVVLGAVRRDDQSAAVLFVDLDRFSVVNDGLGHDIGDEVLVAVGSRLGRVVGERHFVGRLGGDEFLVVLSDLDPEAADDLADRLLEACAAPVATSAGPLQISASAGILHIDRGTNLSLGEAIRSADLAMYRAKHDGRGRLATYGGELVDQVMRRLEVEQALRQQLEAGWPDLALHFQPIVGPVDGRIVGFEALARWDDPVLGRVTPDEFITVAEDAGLIDGLGRWAIDEALRVAALLRAHDGSDHLVVSVNVSGRQLGDAGFVDAVAACLDQHGLPASVLTLELTESSLIEHGAADGDVLDRLRSLGVGLAVDDFGTGYSSLAYLARMPVTAVKIDRSFVDGLADDGAPGRPVVEAVVQLARSFGLAVVAEGVEDELQARRLTELGVEQAQGWLWSPALPAAAAIELVHDDRSAPWRRALESDPAFGG
ncbi:MAG: bifunctional diguanylate cyclase/phosphodiesterase [Actinomycetota bacterium]